MTSVQRMSVLFVGHGNPMNAIEDSPFSTAWKEIAATMPRPEAILSVSAHWETNGTKVTAMESPRTIHDFYGFPDDLFQIQYPAPGSPELAGRVSELLGPDNVTPDDSWGIDHGTWSVLRRMYPDADIPVIQLSLDKAKSPREHIDMAKKLLPLLDEGILVMGSGNIVHNLGTIRWHDQTPYPWAIEFNTLVTELILKSELDKLADYQSLGEAALLSIPTNEHYLPLLYALALRTSDDQVSFFADQVVLGSISMQSLKIGK